MAVKPLSVEELSTPEALDALEPEWRALAAAHGEGLPFRTWEWTRAWWSWYAERSVGVRDELWVRAFRAADGRLVGVAPLVLVRRPGFGPPLMRRLEFIGADPYVTEVRGVLAERDLEGEVFAALRAHLAERAGEWDSIHWSGVRADGAGEAVARAAIGAALPRETACYWLPLTGTWEEFKSSRPRNVKESLRRCYNSLRRAGHRFELTVARTPPEVEAALPRFLALHAARATAGGLREHDDVFRDPASRGFLQDVCARLAVRDAIRLFELRIGDEVVAARLGFALGGTLYLYFSGYAPAWAPFSVMTTTLAESIRYAIDAGFEVVQLSTGTDESKLRWRPEITRYRGGTQYSTRLRGRPVRWVAEALELPMTAPLRTFARGLLGRRRSAR